MWYTNNNINKCFTMVIHLIDLYVIFKIILRLPHLPAYKVISVGYETNITRRILVKEENYSVRKLSR